MLDAPGLSTRAATAGGAVTCVVSVRETGGGAGNQGRTRSRCFRVDARVISPLNQRRCRWGVGPRLCLTGDSGSFTHNTDPSIAHYCVMGAASVWPAAARPQPLRCRFGTASAAERSGNGYAGPSCSACVHQANASGLRMMRVELPERLSDAWCRCSCTWTLRAAHSGALRAALLLWLLLLLLPLLPLVWTLGAPTAGAMLTTHTQLLPKAISITTAVSVSRP